MAWRKVDSRKILFSQLRSFHENSPKLQRTNQYEVAHESGTDGHMVANRLPLPRLQPTIEKYLRSVQPIINELRYKHTELVSKEFIAPGGIGERLQLILEERMRHTENWQYDTYRNISYLDRRLPLPVFCNPTGQILCKDWNGNNQLLNTARLIRGFMKVRKMMKDETFPYATYLGKQLDKRQWRLVFNSCRFPGRLRDYVVHYGYLPDPPLHVVVAYRNQFFRIQTLGSDELPLSTEQIHGQLKQITEMALPKCEVPPIGLLTCLPRDQWADLYNVLQQDPENRKSLEAIHKCFIFMAIDDEANDSDFSSDPLIRLMEYGLHAGGSKNNGGNRWFDKQQYVVHHRQGFGTIMEHSILDGYPTMWVLFTAEKEMLKDKGEDVTSDTDISSPVALKFNPCTEVEAGMARAAEHLDWLTEQNDLSYIQIKDFGGTQIKEKGFNPDSFLQMAQMLAYYRVHGKMEPSQETAGLLHLHLARTDVIRCVSPECLHFCKTMTESPGAVSTRDKYEAMLKAVDCHRRTTREVMAGYGVDNHLLMLLKTADKVGLDKHPFFLDRTFTKSFNNKLRSTQIIAKSNLGPGMGPWFPRTTCILYYIGKENMLYSACKQKDYPTWNASDLTSAVKDTMAEMIELTNIYNSSRK